MDAAPRDFPRERAPLARTGNQHRGWAWLGCRLGVAWTRRGGVGVGVGVALPLVGVVCWVVGVSCACAGVAAPSTVRLRELQAVLFFFFFFLSPPAHPYPMF